MREYGCVQLVRRHRARGVRRVLERVVVPRPAPALDRGDLGADRDHRVEEAVELALDSLSVGSIISVPATGNDIVGAWMPKSIRRFATSSAVTPVASFSGRRSTMHSCATPPFAPV